MASEEEAIPVVDVIEDLETIELPFDEDDASDSLRKVLCFPELANLFGVGCVRPEKRILALTTATRQWNRFLVEDLGRFLKIRILTAKPVLNDLLQLLAERSRDPLKPAFMAPFRSILFFSLLGGRRIFFTASIESFLLSSAPGTLSLQRIPDLPVIVSDLIQIYCCNAARQRRLLPGLLKVFEDGWLQGFEGVGTMSGGWLRDLLDRLRIDMILLLGHLKLLRRDEEVEAAAHLTAIFKEFEQDGRTLPVQATTTGPAQEFSVNDGVRFKHRWDFLKPGLLERRTCPDSILTWYRGMIGAGLSGHSFKQQHWQDDENISSSQQSQNNYTFTMFTSERDTE
jgi:hypothetical protein